MTLYLVDGIDWKHGILGEKTVVAVYNEVWKWPMKLKLDGVNEVYSILQVAKSRNRMHTPQCTPSHPFPTFA